MVRATAEIMSILINCCVQDRRPFDLDRRPQSNHRTVLCIGVRLRDWLHDRSESPFLCYLRSIGFGRVELDLDRLVGGHLSDLRWT